MDDREWKYANAIFFLFFRTNFPHSLKILHREEKSVQFLDLTPCCSSLCYIQVSRLRGMSYWSLNLVSLLPAFCSLLHGNSKGVSTRLQGKLLWGEARAALWWATGASNPCHTRPPNPGQEKQVKRKKRVREKEQQGETSKSWPRLQPNVWGTPSPWSS